MLVGSYVMLSGLVTLFGASALVFKLVPSLNKLFPEGETNE